MAFDWDRRHINDDHSFCLCCDADMEHSSDMFCSDLCRQLYSMRGKPVPLDEKEESFVEF